MFTVELLQRALGTDYQSLLTDGQPWPAIDLFGHAWLPGAALTWLLPVVLLVAGCLVLQRTGHAWQALNDQEAV